MRILISRRRTVARASSRLATFVHAIRRTKPTATISIMRTERTFCDPEFLDLRQPDPASILVLLVQALGNCVHLLACLGDCYSRFESSSHEVLMISAVQTVLLG